MAKPKNEIFNHRTTTDIEGNTMYDAPIEIHTQEDLDNYHISWSDCITITIGGCEQKTVYMIQTKKRELAEYLWCELNNERNREVLGCRCMIPGKQTHMRRCPTTNSCARCPYPDTRMKTGTVSWEQLVESGYEKEWSGEYSSPCEEIAENHLLLEALRERLTAQEDNRLFRVLWMREVIGYSFDKIAEEFGCTKRRVYMLLKAAKEIAKEVLSDNE